MPTSTKNENGLKIENLSLKKQCLSTSVPNSAVAIPSYEKLQIADQMGDIHENFDDNDSCNISNMSSASKENQRAETALSEVKSCSEPNNDN